ncbi:hypothetical protein D4R86_03865 [bacterium]|nr:MAG: hypothetical protein D4R86_03865 [bacterium]
MSIQEIIKAKITECMKSGAGFERDTLRTVLGEIQSLETKQGKITDEECEKVFIKFKQGVEDNMLILKDLPRHEWDVAVLAKMDKEIFIYDKFIPETMSAEDIANNMAFDNDLLKGVLKASSDGAATGIAIKLIKQKSDFFGKVNGKDVAEAVKIFRKRYGEAK